MDNKQFTVSGALKRRGVASWREAGVLPSLGLLKRKGPSSRVTAPLFACIANRSFVDLYILDGHS